jgi:hypothetical protein
MSLRTIAAAMCLALLHCSGDSTIDLPHGYFLARVHSGAFAVVNPHRRLVTRTSRQGLALSVIGDVVVGQIDPAGDASRPQATTFFVVNTATSNVTTDLSQREAVAMLRTFGIQEMPRLRRATRFTTLASLRAADER